MLKSRHLLGDQGDQGSKGDGTKAKEAVREQAAAVTAAEVAKNGHHHQRDAGAGNGSAGAQQPQGRCGRGPEPREELQRRGIGGHNPNRGFLSGRGRRPHLAGVRQGAGGPPGRHLVLRRRHERAKPLQAQHPAGAAQQVQNREAQGQDPSGANGGLPRAISAPPYMQGLQGGESGQLKGTGLSTSLAAAPSRGVGFVEDGQASSFDASTSRTRTLQEARRAAGAGRAAAAGAGQGQPGLQPVLLGRGGGEPSDDGRKALLHGRRHDGWVR